MNYQQAVTAFRRNPTKEVLHAQVKALTVAVQEEGMIACVKQLKGFKRVDLQPGEEKVVEVTVSREEMKFWTPSGWVLDEAYTVYLGTDCANAKAV